MITEKNLYDLSYLLLSNAATILPKDLEEKIKEVYNRETAVSAKAQLETIIQNIQLSRDHQLSICQDPGIIVFEIKVGSKCKFDVHLEEVLTQVTADLTKNLPLRQNIVNPLTKENSGTNTGWGIPYFHYEYVYGADYLEITARLTGGGGIMRSTVISVSSTVPRTEGIKKIIFDHVTMTMGIPCPPTVVGVGIGGTPVIALNLAFKALLRRPVGSSHSDENIAEMERDLLEALNKTGIGVMGLGGDTSVLGIHIDFCGAHTVTPPVGISFSCWPNRYATARLYGNGTIEWITEEGGISNG